MHQIANVCAHARAHIKIGVIEQCVYRQSDKSAYTVNVSDCYMNLLKEHWSWQSNIMSILNFIVTFAQELFWVYVCHCRIRTFACYEFDLYLGSFRSRFQVVLLLLNHVFRRNALQWNRRIYTKLMKLLGHLFFQKHFCDRYICQPRK